MNPTALTLALLAAITFSVSTSVQHQAAGAAPASVGGLFELLAYLLHRPLWLLGQLVAVCAFALHASALHAGAIAVVQPIVVSGIVWAVPIRAAISRRLPSGRELRAVLVTAAGLAVFLVASNPTKGAPASLGWETVGLSAALVAVLVAANVAAGRAQAPGRRAFLLGVVGGVAFGLVAGFMKLALQELNDGGLAALLTAWPTYALLVAGAIGVLTNQRAYRIAALSASMPALNIVNGLTALLFGFTVFAEVPRHSPPLLVVEGLALAAMAIGLWLLVNLEEDLHEVTEPSVVAGHGPHGPTPA